MNFSHKINTKYALQTKENQYLTPQLKMDSCQTPRALEPTRSQFGRPRNLPAHLLCVLSAELLLLWKATAHFQKGAGVCQLRAACFLAWSRVARSMCLAYCPARRPSTGWLEPACAARIFKRCCFLQQGNK